MSDFKDEHAGKGGSYVADADGRRVLQAAGGSPRSGGEPTGVPLAGERTDYVAPKVQQTKPGAPTSSKKPTVKGVNDVKSTQ